MAELDRIERFTAANKQEAISKSLKNSKVFARHVAAAKNKDAATGLPPEIRGRERVRSVLSCIVCLEQARGGTGGGREQGCHHHPDHRYL